MYIYILQAHLSIIIRHEITRSLNLQSSIANNEYHFYVL